MPKLAFIPALLPISNKLHNVLNQQYEEQLKTNMSLFVNHPINNGRLNTSLTSLTWGAITLS